MAKVGRPSDYSEKAHLALYAEYMSEAIPENMRIPSVEGLALKLGKSKQALYRWAKANKKFRNALRDLRLKQKEILTTIGIFGGKEINSNIVMLMLKVNHKMIETTKTDITSGGKPIYGGKSK